MWQRRKKMQSENIDRKPNESATVLDNNQKNDANESTFKNEDKVSKEIVKSKKVIKDAVNVTDDTDNEDSADIKMKEKSKTLQSK